MRTMLGEKGGVDTLRGEYLLPHERPHPRSRLGCPIGTLKVHTLSFRSVQLGSGRQVTADSTDPRLVRNELAGCWGSA